MKSMAFTVALFVLAPLAMLCWPATGAEPPKLLYLPGRFEQPKPFETPPAYVKKDTWRASMLASLEATFGRSDAEDRTAAGTSGFRPAIIRLATDARPVRLELRVDGLERLYFAALGRLPENGSAHFLSPRLFDQQGHSVELRLDGAMLEGKPDPRAARATALEVDGAKLRGFALAPGEVSFKLDGKYERLEVFVCYQPETGLPPHAAVDCRPVFARALECRRVQESLWDLAARDFRDRQSQIEMETERRDGIWGQYAPGASGDGNAYYLALARQRLALARKTLQFVQRTAPRPQMAAELQGLEQQVDRDAKSLSQNRAGDLRSAVSAGSETRAERSFGIDAKDPAGSTGRNLFARAVALRRRIIFSHPALDFDRLLLVKQPPPDLSARGTTTTD